MGRRFESMAMPRASFGGERSEMSHSDFSCSLNQAFFSSDDAAVMMSSTWTAKMMVPVVYCRRCTHHSQGRRVNPQLITARGISGSRCVQPISRH